MELIFYYTFLCEKVLKSQVWGSGSLQVGEHIPYWEGDAPQFHPRQKLLCSRPSIPHPVNLFISLFICISHPFNKLVDVNK